MDVFRGSTQRSDANRRATTELIRASLTVTRSHLSQLTVLVALFLSINSGDRKLTRRGATLPQLERGNPSPKLGLVR
jgi:hypothetical protein